MGKDAITIDDEWLELKKLTFSSGVTLDEVEKLVDVKPIRISLEVILPKGVTAPLFNYKKNAEMKKFRSVLESKVEEALSQIVDEDDIKDAKPILDKLNAYLKKAVVEFRVQLRTAIAKEIGGKTRADDLMTAGSVDFNEVEFQFGVGDGLDNPDAGMLDLTKALRRTKRVQHLGVSWKGIECVVSIKAKKPFKNEELKALRKQLPDGFSKGAAMEAGEFTANSKTDVEIDFPEKASKIPLPLVVRRAFKKQTGGQVRVAFGIMEPDSSPKKKEEKSGKKKEEGSEEEKKSKEKSKETNEAQDPKQSSSRKPAPPKGPAASIGKKPK